MSYRIADSWSTVLAAVVAVRTTVFLLRLLLHYIILGRCYFDIERKQQNLTVAAVRVPVV